MPRRVYLSPIIGTGTEGDPQRAAVSDDPKVTACRSVISVHPLTGMKRLGWAVCRVEANNFTGVDAIIGAVHIPRGALESRMPVAVREKLNGELRGDVALGAGATTREVVRELVRAHYPRANEEAVL